MTSGDAMEMSDLRAAAVSAFVYLEKVRYPARRQDLIDQARSEYAPDGVLALLSRLSDMEYAGPADVSREMDRVTRIRHVDRRSGIGGESP